MKLHEGKVVRAVLVMEDGSTHESTEDAEAVYSGLVAMGAFDYGKWHEFAKDEKLAALQRLFVAAEELSRCVSRAKLAYLDSANTDDPPFREALSEAFRAQRKFEEVPSYTGPLDKLDRDVELARQEERRAVWEKAAEDVEAAFKAIPSTPESDAAHNVLVTRFMGRAFLGP